MRKKNKNILCEIAFTKNIVKHQFIYNIFSSLIYLIY